MWRWLGCLLLGVAGWVGAAEKYPVAVLSNKVAGGYEIVVRNPGAAVVSLRIDIADGDNIRSDAEFPLYLVVQPRQPDTVLAKVTPEEARKKYSFRLRWRWVPGDFNARHDPAVLYRLPFADGKRFLIGQAPGGPVLTHTGPESAQAVDIPMPEGTPIVAARDGLVIQSETGHTRSSRTDPMAKANAVRILHADGTLATYSHLKPNGVLVKDGQHVRAGDTIGLSGATGYVTGPHLHFAVFQPQKSETDFAQVSLPFRFYVGNPPLAFTPEYGQVVEANYSQPAQPPRLSPRVAWPSGDATK